LAAIATVAAVAGIVGAYLVYYRRRQDVARQVEKPILAKGWLYDATVSAFMGGPGRALFDGIARFDKTVVDGAVNGVGTLVGEGAARGRITQTGMVRNYALGLALGVVVVAGLLLSKAAF
jgi:NADH-quinone oxidoreductase subunit L